jgi:hypothetical protein
MRVSALTLIVAALGAKAATAQPPSRQYYPVDHRTPGMAAQWNVAIDPTRASRVQLVEVTLPEGVEIASSNAAEGETFASTVQADLMVGRTYRFRLSNLEGYPGVELSPSVEMIDSLHAPAGHEREFPVPIEITQADIDEALQNRLVTKVIYLEQSNIALPKPQVGGPHTTDFSPHHNLMKVADERGRPIAIVRLGGRQGDPSDSGMAPGDSVPLTPIGRASSRNAQHSRLADNPHSEKTPATAEAAADAPIRGDKLMAHGSDQPRPFPE